MKLDHGYISITGIRSILTSCDLFCRFLYILIYSECHQNRYLGRSDNLPSLCLGTTAKNLTISYSFAHSAPQSEGKWN